MDNKSGDESLGRRAFLLRGSTLIETGENLGFAGGVNRGLRETARGHYVMIMNPDLEISSAGSLDETGRFPGRAPRDRDRLRPSC